QERLAPFDDRDWPAARIGQLQVVVDPEGVIDRRSQIFRPGWTVDRISGILVARAIYCAAADAGTREYGREERAPGAAAPGVGRGRGAAHFAQADDERLVQEAAGRKIVEQRGECIVKRRQQV